MAAPARTLRSVALAIVLVTLAGITVPLCTMPECDAGGVQVCSDFIPACGDCSTDTVFMKHARDEAVRGEAASTDTPAVAFVLALPEIVRTSVAPRRVPEQSAAPPPLEPLGMRLTI